MKMIKVDSSNLESIGYVQLLRISFKGGGTYEYEGVPEGVYSALMGAESKGSFFHKNIKGAYPYKKISPEKSIIDTKDKA